MECLITSADNHTTGLIFSSSTTGLLAEGMLLPLHQLSKVNTLSVVTNVTSKAESKHLRYSVNTTTTTTTTTVLWPFFRDHPGEPVPEENFWTLWCKGRLTEADTMTIRLGATPSRLTSAHLHHPPYFLQARYPSCRPTNSVKALKATLLQLYYVIGFTVY